MKAQSLEERVRERIMRDTDINGERASEELVRSGKEK